MATILVVDDSTYARRRLREALETAGHSVREAASGMAALESFSVEAPNLVMLDLTMEDLSGFEVLRRLRELDPEVRVIVVSADIQRSTESLAAAAGARAFLPKPTDPDALLAAVDAALGEVTR
jgi:DNA-binding response OmpR family regulator